MEVLSPERMRFYLRGCSNPTLSGCRGCAAPVGKGKQFYCDDRDCKITFEANHFYRTAARTACFLAAIPSAEYPETCDGSEAGEWCWTHEVWLPHAPAARPSGYRCARCLQSTVSPEVNHIRPLNGDRHHFGCQHHLVNLEVLCHECHLATTAWQRENRLIGARR